MAVKEEGLCESEGERKEGGREGGRERGREGRGRGRERGREGEREGGEGEREGGREGGGEGGRGERNREKERHTPGLGEGGGAQLWMCLQRQRLGWQSQTGFSGIGGRSSNYIHVLQRLLHTCTLM